MPALRRSATTAEVSAEIPDSELGRYTIELRALTAGSGWFRRSYLRHHPAPAKVLPMRVSDRSAEK